MTRPIRTTVVYALASGLTVVPAAMMLNTYLPWSTAFKLTVWADLALYGVLLARWSGTRLLPVLFPLAVLLSAALWHSAYGSFFILCLGVLAWMRSGVCFQGSAPVRIVTAEAVATVGGAALVLFLGGHSSAALALNICLFFMFQALYFFLVPMHRKPLAASAQRDPFEQAVEDANKILDGL